MIKINLITEESSTRTLTNIPKVMRLVTGKDSAPKKPTNKLPDFFRKLKGTVAKPVKALGKAIAEPQRRGNISARLTRRIDSQQGGGKAPGSLQTNKNRRWAVEQGNSSGRYPGGKAFPDTKPVFGEDTK